MIDFEFLRPHLAWLLAGGILALVAGGLALARSRRELSLWVVERQVARFLPGFSRSRAALRVVLGAAGLLLLALAALGPVRGYTFRAVSRKGLDLVLCIDTSRSMLAQDLRPSRLDRAKREIIGLLDQLKGDRVALVAFSGDARDVAPLTRDHAALKGLLTFVSPEDNQEGGTDLAAAIEHALSLFDGRTGAHEAVVLLTDGEDLGGKGLELAEEALKRSIRIYVVGIGTEAGGKIPVTDAGGHQSFLRDPDGNEVVTKLARASLESLARRTGGDYLSAEEAPTPLEDLYRARISRIEGREIEGGERRVPNDRYQWPLALGVLLLGLELGVRERVRRRGEEREAPRLAAALLPLFLVGGDESFSFARSLENAVRHHRQGEPEAAEQAARALLEHAGELGLDEVERAQVQYTLGVIAATRSLDDADPAEAARDAARDAFSAARALAGPGALRLDATYDLGELDLFRAEALRAQLPEVSGQPAGAPPPAPAGANPAVPPVPPPDPLPEARTAYGAAKTWFLERLRLDWSDADTRANLELIQRRLHELDEIEKKREQKQDPQNQDPNQQQDKDSNPSQDPKDQKDKQDSQQDQGKPDEQKPDPQEKQDQDSKDAGKPEDEEQPKPDQPKPEEAQQQPEGEKGEEKQAPPPQGEKREERVLTREEVMQLLDKLAQLEKQQKALEAALRAKRRATVKRDW